ncbi:MAG: hypothetical protein K0R24_1106, partial [Gammaproteobacteria bacterium]|nr:hypothetical protein [Gammaproteobacteria bacterium]
MSQSHDHNHNFEQKKKALTPLNTPAGQSLLKRLADKGRHFNRREQEDAAEETNTQTPNDLMIERETTHSPAQSPEIKTIDSPATVSTEDKPTSATLTD